MKALLLVMLAACGGAPASGTSSDVPFDKLDHHQKVELMKQQVVPTMKPLFQNHDAKFGDFGCETCHGKQPEDRKFAMPNPDLPKLDFGNMGQFKPEDVAWMKNDIMPTMAKLLNLPPHSADNPNGFGCLGCHTQVGH
jgi:hypothetical protein